MTQAGTKAFTNGGVHRKGGEGERAHRGWCCEEGREVGNGWVQGCQCLSEEQGNLRERRVRADSQFRKPSEALRDGPCMMYPTGEDCGRESTEHSTAALDTWPRVRDCAYGHADAVRIGTARWPGPTRAVVHDSTRHPVCGGGSGATGNDRAGMGLCGINQDRDRQNS